MNRSSHHGPTEQPASNHRVSSRTKRPLFEEVAIDEAAALEFEGANKGILVTIFHIVRRKRFIAAVGILLLATTGVLLKEAGYLAPEIFFGFLNAHPMLAPIAFVALFVLMTLLLLPTLPLNLGAGFLWGPYLGGFYTVVGASLGAAIAFLVSRHFAAELLNRYFRHRTWIWLMEQVHKQDWKVVAFTRINPIFPTALLNYFFGLTPIRFGSYLATTVVFIAPMALVFAYLGDSVGGFLLRGNAYQFAQNILGASAAITIILLLRFGLKRLFEYRRRDD